MNFEGLQCSHTRKVCRIMRHRYSSACPANCRPAKRCHLVVSSVRTRGSSTMCL